MPFSNFTIFPSQKKSFAEKTKKDNKWGKECVDVAEQIATLSDSPLRQTHNNKQVNYDLFNNKLDTKDIERILNPLGITSSSFPAKMQNYPIGNTKIERLLGEEPNRRFDYIVRVINDDAVSSKENQRKDAIFKTVAELIRAENPSQQQFAAQMQKLSKYYNYEEQDIRELTATRLLSYFYKTMNLRWTFNMGFADALIAGEECYCVDILGGEPVVFKPNMKNLFVLRGGTSNYIDDADMIIYIDYASPGQLIDDYYDELTPSEIDTIESGMSKPETSVIKYSLTPYISVQDIVAGKDQSDLIYVNDIGINVFGGAYDQNGNMKRVRVVWKSMVRVGEVESTDEMGNVIKDYVSEGYKQQTGEKINWIWVNQWWEGTKLGNDIYLKIQPRPFQMRKKDNISSCKSGYVGTIYSFNLDRAQSIMDRMKPYLYLYNIFMYRTELAFAKAKGAIAEINLAMLPPGWDLDKWMYYIDTMGLLIVNPFNEINEGSAKGKLAGNFANVGGRTMNLSEGLGNYIQQHISMLQYIEEQIGQTTGVPKAREGNIEQRDAVGNVQQTMVQSSYITDRWYMVHDNIKVRVLEALVEAAKQAWKNKSRKLQYVLDDLSTVFLNIDDDFINSEYGIYIATSMSDTQIFNDLRSVMMQGYQRDKISLKGLMDVYLTESVASMRRKIENAEEEMHHRQLEIIQEQNKVNAQTSESAMQMGDKKMLNDRDMEIMRHGMELEKMRQKSDMDADKKEKQTRLEAELAAKEGKK